MRGIIIIGEAAMGRTSALEYLLIANGLEHLMIVDNTEEDSILEYKANELTYAKLQVYEPSFNPIDPKPVHKVKNTSVPKHFRPVSKQMKSTCRRRK